MEVKTPREFFEKALPSKFDPKRAAGLDAVVQMNIAGSDGGDWTVVVRDQKLTVNEGTGPSPSISIKMADTDFVDLVNRKLNAMHAFMAGKLKFEGSIALGLRLLDSGIL